MGMLLSPWEVVLKRSCGDVYPVCWRFMYALARVPCRLSGRETFVDGDQTVGRVFAFLRPKVRSCR
ncbi:MAG: hypothetical protein DIU84_07930 [Bacillota bacterium]|nr:MAG: hypothetical protein DIU84_07930 [Bacillota bacterium]